MASDERDPRTYAIIGAAQRVHRELGPGFLERVYHQALCIELADRGIPFQAEVALPVHYRGRRLDAVYRADAVVGGEVVVELKALPALTWAEAAQLLHYLKAAALQTGLLLNFGAASLEVRRMAWSPSAPQSLASAASVA
jgi:GxxExxY protein